MWLNSSQSKWTQEQINHNDIFYIHVYWAFNVPKVQNLKYFSNHISFSQLRFSFIDTEQAWYCDSLRPLLLVDIMSCFQYVPFNSPLKPSTLEMLRCFHFFCLGELVLSSWLSRATLCASLRWNPVILYYWGHIRAIPGARKVFYNHEYVIESFTWGDTLPGSTSSIHLKRLVYLHI